MKRTDLKNMTDHEVIETVAELHETRTCPDHREEYHVLIGCSQCRQEARERDELLERIRQKRELALRQMAEAETVHRATIENIEAHYDMWNRRFIKAWIAVLVLVAIGCGLMAGNNSRMEREQARQEHVR